MTIKVASIFEKGALKPVWFIHDKRKYTVKEICYRWITRNGVSKVYHFAVSDGANTFEISFDDKEMTWDLKEKEL